MELKRVVVTGIGAITPIGKTVPEYWDGLKNGVSGAAPITRFDTEKFKTKFACEVKNYKPEDYFHKKEARKLDLFTQFAIIAGEEAIKNANIDFEKIDKDRAGVIWASGIGGITTLAEDVITYAQNDFIPRFSPFFIPKIITDIAAGHLSIKYDMRGPNFATVSACASSSHAIIEAYHYIKLGKADIMLTGGSEAPLNPPAVGGFNSMHAISTRNDSPETASRPFDVDRDGFVMAEGGAGLILEEYEHAVKRGATIYCELVGAAATADANHITAPHPEGRGAAKVMEFALKEGNLKPEDVDYINVHGTSTKLGDISETKAIVQVFGSHAPKLNISSTKSMIGHLLGGAGAVEAVATILAMQNSLVPPTINLFNLDPEISDTLNLTPNKAQEREINVAISNTFGFGGHNACLAFKKI
jgi:3-oxoacyl-[acyl-carrier-protein] synthase II